MLVRVTGVIVRMKSKKQLSKLPGLRREKESKRKAEEEGKPPREEPEAKEEEGKEAEEEEEEKPVLEEEPSPEAVVFPPEEPPKEITLPQMPMPQIPVPRPRRASGKKAAEEDADLESTKGVAGDTMARLHAELVAQHEMMDIQLATAFLARNRVHVVAFVVLFLILIRAIVLRRERERKRKSEEEGKPPREEPEAKEEEGKEAEEEEEEKPVLEEEPSTEAVVLPPEEPPKEITLPQMPMPQIPVPRPRRKPKAEVPPEKQPEEPGGDGIPDEEFIERPITRSRTRKEFVRKKVPPPEAPTQVQPGIEEEEEVEEEPFQQPPQPPLVEPTTIPPTWPQLPEQPVPVLAPGVPEVAYVEPSVPPAVVTPLEKCWASEPVKASIGTLGFLANASITLKQENEDQILILRKKTLDRLAALDKALKEDILVFQKVWMKGMLQLDRIPLEVDANFIQELNLLLSRSRQAPVGLSPSGITDIDMQSIREMFAQQHEDVQALETAQDYDGVSAATGLERASENSRGADATLFPLLIYPCYSVKEWCFCDSFCSAVPVLAPGVPEIAYVEPSVPPAVVTVPPHEIPELAPIPWFLEDGEMQRLRARRSLFSSLVDVATRMVDELPGNEAQRIVKALKKKLQTAEKAEREYDISEGRRDPNLPSIRKTAIDVISSSIEGSRDGLLQLVNMAKAHGEQVFMHCSERLFFTNVERFRKPLEKCWDSEPVKASIGTLGFLANTSITLKQENEDQLRILRSAQFVDEYKPHAFVDIYAAIAAMNFKKRTLDRLAALDKALKEDILVFQKVWMKGMLQLDRIPLEVDANFIQELNLLLSRSRRAPVGQSPSGITNIDMQSIREMFAQQHEDVQALETAQDYEGVSAAYERAKLFNEKLKYLLDVQKNKLHATLERQPLTKEEANAAAEAMTRFAETALDEGEDCWRYLQIVNSEISGKYEEGPGVSTGKALLQMLTTKKKAGTAESGEAVINPDSAVATGVKQYFSELWRHIDTTARDHWIRAQDMLEKVKKGAKYKLDKEGFGSTALDAKTNLRVEIARTRTEGAIPSTLLRYFSRLVKELESYDDTVKAVFVFPLQQEAPEWRQIGILKEKFDFEKALARDSQSSAAVPGHADTILQTCLQIRTLFESARSAQLKQAMEKPYAVLHGAEQG
ncbi:uncharacterized protein EMH_0003940 [Eimeria mitis]|uniref:Uncharacterized protein n=1 Tax=Eimeria mitis TaxID=44415 RepID=U6JXI0_9EIME|nr:uncharacterized protein EMH_0003940 [Eimeria mitis]CDJ29446.1 hypothetical protein EMH_0003940 [Eimeria mitis]